MTIGNRIKELRTSLGMTQDELAKLTGYKSRSSIQKIESGERDITQSAIVSFARALKVAPSVIMGWDRELDDLDWKVLELYPDYNPKSGYISNTVSSKHEQEVLNAYRKAEKPLRDGIDRMLGVEPITVAPEPQTNGSSNLARIAALGGGTQNIPRPKISDEELNKMVEEAERDNLLAEIRANKSKKS